MSKHQTFLPRTIQLGVMPADRKAIEAEIEALISILDDIDGDPDLEPDHEDYDPCDSGEPEDYLDTLPLYGSDQSMGPINENEAHQAQTKIRRMQYELSVNQSRSQSNARKCNHIACGCNFITPRRDRPHAPPPAF